MKPKYSVLFCNQNFYKYQSQMEEWLHSGIKIFWFGTKDEVHLIKEKYASYSSALFLQAFEVKSDEMGIIEDGDSSEELLKILEKKCPEFNAAQYRVEHCQAQDNIVVQASAGTGKTSVMIDRIMFLMHTVSDLHLSDIYMITFTNDATKQMNERLQNMLLKRYELTGNKKYLEWLEEQSQMSISTIHSFALKLFRTFGTEIGFTKETSMKSLKYERKELIKDEMDEVLVSNRSMFSQLGMSLYKANSTIDKFWKKFAQLGFSQEQIEELDWGEGVDIYSQKFQDVFSEVLVNFDESYFETKRKNNAISVDDILRDLYKVLSFIDSSQFDLHMKYLFVDEFQDSDNSQISVLGWIAENINPALFVVGDIKQSIYRFRGATDTAFDTLNDELISACASYPKTFTLINNYRTASNVMTEMDEYFKQWDYDGILQYEEPVVPFNKQKGVLRMYASAGKNSFDQEFVKIANAALEDLAERLGEETEQNEKNRVVVLTRSNFQLNQIAAICKKNKIPCEVNREGEFFLCEAVRDFYAMISSFIFSDEPKYLFQYLLTPYANADFTLDIAELESYKGEKEDLLDYLDSFLIETSWEIYYKEFRLQPVMAVIKEIIENGDVVDRYIANAKRREIENGVEDDDTINKRVYMKAKKYKANLEKLLVVLQRNMNGEFTSLYDIYQYLKLSIATNRTENEAEVETNSDYRSLYCMTVHKSKGMEFDTVIIPYTSSHFYREKVETELITSEDRSRVGWRYHDENTGTTLENTLYQRVRLEENRNATEEETRILYVAMTRAINSLYALVSPNPNENTWAYLIREVGVDIL